MARAFTKESDNETLQDPLPAFVDVLPPGVKNYITPAGAVRLKESLARLVNEERPQAVKAAGSTTDPVAKRKIQQIDQQIRMVGNHIANFEIVDPSKQDSGRVAFGATVRVGDEEGNERTYTICGIDEVEVDAGRISWISPIAKTLRSKQEGDEVTLQLPAGTVVLRILSIDYP